MLLIMPVCRIEARVSAAYGFSGSRAVESLHKSLAGEREPVVV